MAPSSEMVKLCELLKTSKNIIAVTGAGLSAASGIPTFRGAGGLWKKHEAMSLATPEAFEENPSRVWQFYHMRREAAMKAQPNAAHYALADLCTRDRLRTIAPQAESFTLITQNVDGLSVRALNERLISANKDPISPDSAHSPPQGGELSHIYEMHGRVLDVQCSDPSCGYVVHDPTSPLCASLGRASEQELDNPDFEADILVDELPKCAKCGEMSRPGVVWFGEQPVHLREIYKAVDRADLCLVIGTSSQVYPAAGLASQVQSNGGKVAVFNLDRSDGDDEADFLFLGPCEETLPSLIQG